ncbi:BON domain-containing protein [Mucilaginibacter antarcticus]|uniref:BON domain-containing protein n=1 Tax=Mucilaginibacter antarcticus TaxID=1855725 RepID=A0ABW5XRI2_9SPHI
MSNVRGIKIFTNNLLLAAEPEEQLEKKTIEHALLRYAATVDQKIRVTVFKNMITLNGTVQSFYQKEEAEKIAWNAPGVLMIKNELIVE